MAAFTLASAKSAARQGIAAADETAATLAAKSREVALTPPVPEIVAELAEGAPRRQRLVDDGFPFDESQLAAVKGMIDSKYACLTGAAGTGKTTVTKRFVDDLLDSVALGFVDLRNYWKEESAPADGEDDYDLDDSQPVVPSIAMCAFTGKASQQVKRNFPVAWHNNIMTIHRLLAFVPDYYEDWDSETQGYKKKMRFIPTYNASIKLPWDVVIVDETGMLGLELWHQLLDALQPHARIYFIGDINQLPPIYGKSIFGFAMARWPTFELAKVHRQKGANNPIVDNAWRVIHGLRPETEGRFKMVELPVDSLKASSQVRAISRKLHQIGVYKPLRDAVISPIHGINPGTGAALGDYPLNEHYSHMFNDESGNPRYVIDGGREKKMFAVGDKVMATKNDWESGITNGMTGHIIDIIENHGYQGARIHYGILSEVNARFATGAGGLPLDTSLDLDDLDNLVDEMVESKRDAAKDGKESRDRGPASHTVVVQFGDGDSGFSKPFESLAEVGTLQLAYVMTCHKMQGGEAPTIIIILHESHSRSLTREWLYTAITRASENCILLYTDRGLRIALNRQAIEGANLRQKVLAFQRIMDPTGDGRGLSDIRLPVSESSYPTILEQAISSDAKSQETERRLATAEVRTGGLAQLLAKHKPVQAERVETPAESIKVEVERVIKVKIIDTIQVNRTFTLKPAERPAPDAPRDVDGGDLTPVRTAAEKRAEYERVYGIPSWSLSAPTPVRLVSQVGAARMAELLQPTGIPLLAYQPAPEPVKPPLKTIAGLFRISAKKTGG